MRVALVVPGFSADADDWCIPALRGLVRQLAGAADIHVFALRYPAGRPSYDLFGARVTALGGGPARGRESAALWWRTATALTSEHRRRPFDVLHAFWAGEPGFVAALVGRALRVPTVVSVAGGELARLVDIGYGGRLRWGERMKTRLALRLAGVVTAGSAQAVASARRWCREGRSRRIPLGVDLAMFAPAPPAVGKGAPRLLHVASLVPVKDQAMLVRATAILSRRGYVFHLELIGSGPLESELRLQIGRLGMQEMVHLRGAIAHEKLAGEYGRAQLFVLSSRHEAQGMVALEAAACQLPIVGTEVGVIPELAPDAARMAGVGDARALADGIAGFLDDDQARLRSGWKARALAEAEFGLDRCANRYLDLYAELDRLPSVPVVAA